MYFKFFNYIKRIFKKGFNLIFKSTYFIKNILRIIVLLIIIYLFIKKEGWF